MDWEMHGKLLEDIQLGKASFMPLKSCRAREDASVAADNHTTMVMLRFSKNARWPFTGKTRKTYQQIT